MEQLEQGKSADLEREYGGDFRERRLRAKFLEALLTDGITIKAEKKFTPHRKGIRIAQAVIAEAIDLENAEVAHIVDLDNCLFKKEVSLRDAHFKRHLFLNDSQFKKDLNCHRLRVKIDFSCRGTTFQGSE